MFPINNLRFAHILIMYWRQKETKLEKKHKKVLLVQEFAVSLQSQFKNRALSSAGSERLPYKQRVVGSNPSAPTQEMVLAP